MHRAELVYATGHALEISLVLQAAPVRRVGSVTDLRLQCCLDLANRRWPALLAAEVLTHGSFELTMRSPCLGRWHLRSHCITFKSTVLRRQYHVGQRSGSRRPATRDKPPAIPTMFTPARVPPPHECRCPPRGSARCRPMTPNLNDKL